MEPWAPCAQCGAEPGEPAGWSKVVLVEGRYDPGATLVSFVALGPEVVYYFDTDECRAAWLGRLTA